MFTRHYTHHKKIQNKKSTSLDTTMIEKVDQPIQKEIRKAILDLNSKNLQEKMD